MVQADALEVGRAPGPDAFQVLQRRVEGDHGEGSGLMERRALTVRRRSLLHDHGGAGADADLPDA